MIEYHITWHERATEDNLLLVNAIKALEDIEYTLLNLLGREGRRMRLSHATQ